MPVKTRDNRIAASYKVHQPINNFKLRVRIEQQRPLLAELLEAEGDARDSNYLEEEDHIFNWQEKIFSPSEINFFGDEKNCLLEYQKGYHQRIKEQESQGSSLYSYTEVDSYYYENQLLTKPYKSRLSIKNQSALPALKNRKPFSERYNKKVVDEHPAGTRIQSNHYLYTECSTMHVMVDLSRRDETLTDSNDFETLLCTVTYDRFHQILTIDPDFTGVRCYTVTNSSGVKFNYWIANASEKQTRSELQKQQNDLRRGTGTLVHGGGEILGDFELVSPNTTKILLNMDIVSARDFDFDGLFITYCIDLPEGWKTDQKERLCGRTQRAILKNKTAGFSYATDIALEFQSNHMTKANQTLPLRPRLLISVASFDSWTRYRTEGYAALSLPTTYGSHKFNVPTWRPTGSIINSLRRFFTGGTYELEDITQCGIPQGHESKILNQSDLKVVQSGSVEINFNVVLQTSSSAEDIFQGSYGRLSANTLINNVESIFEQFKAARERMLRIRNLNL